MRKILLIVMFIVIGALKAFAQEGLEEGLTRKDYPTGMYEQSYFKAGKRDGISRYYDAQGNLRQESTYANGVLLDESGKPVNGVRTEHLPYSAWQKNTYKNGLLDGLAQAYDESDQLLFERKFSKGRVVAYRAIAKNVPGPRTWTKL